MQDKKTTGFELDELNRIYSRAEEADKGLFAEQRSNILMVAGDHYAKINARISAQLRQSNKPSTVTDQKLRLTKNHMHKIHRAYKTAILSGAPDTAVFPKNETELQDKKDAELNQSVWLDIKQKAKLKERRSKWADQFVGIGEVCAKVFWNPDGGDFLGYEGKTDEETGQPVLEPTGEVDPQTGQPAMAQTHDETKPVFSGALEFEDVYGFNLLREVGADGQNDHRAWVVRKMADLKELKPAFRDNPEVLEKLTEEQTETYIVFDEQKGAYEKRKGQCMVREFYWPKCTDYPEGWFCYATKTVKMVEGPLPFGIWPLIYKAFDEYPTSARGRSILKVARPYQAEINRASSQMAVAQVTLGDDKILYQAGSKLAPGALLPGVRGIAYQGQTPTVLAGRSGSQYVDYVNAQIQEMYSVVMIDDEDEAVSGQLDPYTLLFRSAKQRKKYNPYTEKFEEFQREMTFTALCLAQKYLPDDALIAAVGRRERVNIQEFRSTNPLDQDIRVDSQDESLETTFGRQLTFQHILQYVGKDLDKATIGKIIKNSPFANTKDDFDDLTIDQDIADNDMLALERGEQVQPTKYLDPTFALKKLAKRQKESDFRFLDPNIQQNYAALTQGYEQIAAQQAAAIAAAKNEFIPVDGALVTCDFYVPPKNPEEQAKRAKIPQRSLDWLMQRLQEQGMTLDKMETMNAQNLSDIAGMMTSNGGQMPGQGQGQGGVNPAGMRPQIAG